MIKIIHYFLINILINSFYSDNWISVSFLNNKYVVNSGKLNDALVTARYKDTMLLSGWNKLEIFVNSKTADEQTYHAIGVAEGYFTSSLIDSFHGNIHYYLSTLSQDNALNQDVLNFLDESKNYVQDFFKNEQSTEVNKQVEMLWNQFSGLIDGYTQKDTGSAKLTEKDFWFLENIGDLNDIIRRYQPWPCLNEKSNCCDLLSRRDQGTSIVKLRKRNEELYVMHNTWFTYSALTKIHKCIHFPLANGKTSSVSFTSYPGLLHSLDDFYIVGDHVCISGVALPVLSSDALNLMKSKALPCWMRAMIGIMKIGEQNGEGRNPGDIFSEALNTESSGTRNGEWLIVDYSHFEPKKTLKDGAVFRVEASPLSVIVEDVSKQLREEESIMLFGVPPHESIRNELGFTDFLEKQSNSALFYSPSESRRKKVMQKVSRKVHDLNTAKWAIRYNDYLADEESILPSIGKDPGTSIASRHDLRNRTETAEADNFLPPKPYGAIDAKITSAFMMKDSKNFLMIAGPTTSHQLPPVSISGLSKDLPFAHKGLAESYKFGWIQADWDGNRPVEKQSLFITIISIICAGIVSLSILLYTLGTSVRCIRDRKRKNYRPINDIRNE